MRLGPGATPLTVGATLPRTWAGSGWRLSGRVQTLSGVTSMVAGIGPELPVTLLNMVMDSIWGVLNLQNQEDFYLSILIFGRVISDIIMLRMMTKITRNHIPDSELDVDL